MFFVLSAIVGRAEIKASFIAPSQGEVIGPDDIRVVDWNGWFFWLFFQKRAKEEKIIYTYQYKINTIQ